MSPLASIVCADLSFSWEDGTTVFQDLSFSVGAGRTGLIAPNGAGKSTLLKLIAGVYRPARGSVTVGGELGYLPQDLPLRVGATVAEALGVAAIVAAIDAVESGDVAEEHFTVIGDDWDVEERSRGQLDRLGLGDLALDRRLETLSGGQIVSLGLAGRLLQRPDVLLLDEPTNNLDAAARHRLAAVLDDFTGCLLLVSHDRMLLEHMDRIAELDQGRAMRLYGGGFTDYEEAVRAEQDAAERSVRSAESELKREKREMQQARERAERRAGNAARTVKNAGLPRIIAGARQRAAQNSAGRAGQMHAGRVDDARARLDIAARALRDDARITVDLPDTRVPAGRTLFLGEGIRLRRGGHELFAGDGVGFVVRGPERIALIGDNGVGKSSLLRVIAGGLEPDAGRVKRGEGRVAYLSQRLDLLDPDRSVAENLATFASATPQPERMNLLARFLFRGDRAHLPVSVLSGGELLRATLACVLCADRPPQLLLLDEPTNNLDLVSVAQLGDALAAYEGAFVVVSHDERFLDDIAVDRRLELSEERLLDTAVSRTDT